MLDYQIDTSAARLIKSRIEAKWLWVKTFAVQFSAKQTFNLMGSRALEEKVCFRKRKKIIKISCFFRDTDDKGKCQYLGSRYSKSDGWNEAEYKRHPAGYIKYKSLTACYKAADFRS